MSPVDLEAFDELAERALKAHDALLDMMLAAAELACLPAAIAGAGDQAARRARAVEFLRALQARRPGAAPELERLIVSVQALEP